jgi:hypothetical protein
MDKLPLYELRIDPEADSFVSAVALVEEPAIEADFIAFNKQQEFSFSMDDEKMELLGPAMIPNLKIYRRNPDGMEYQVYFSEATIRQIAQTFFQKGFQSNINLDHTATPANTYIYQSYITDSTKGINAPKGLDLPDGSWVVGMKVTDQKVWESIKKGERKGFSVEGLFSFFNKQRDVDQEILETLTHLHNLINKSK